MDDHHLQGVPAAPNDAAPDAAAHGAPAGPPPAPAAACHLAPLAAARALLDFLAGRPDHQAHQELLRATGLPEEELREAPLVLRFSVVELAQHSPALARALVTELEPIRMALMDSLYSDGVLPQLRHPRLRIRLYHVSPRVQACSSEAVMPPPLHTPRFRGCTAQVPVAPCRTVRSVSEQALLAVSSSSLRQLALDTWGAPLEPMPSQAPPSPSAISLHSAVVLGLSTCWSRKYAQTWRCLSCDSDTCCLYGQEVPERCSSCGQPSTSLKEDLPQR
jgi:hypothetical protein